MQTATTTPAHLGDLTAHRPPAALQEPTSYRKAAGWVIAGLWVAAIAYVLVLSLAAGQPGVGGVVVEQIVLLVLWGAATPAILWSAERLPIERVWWIRGVAMHGAIATAFIIALNVIGLTLAWLITGRPTPYADVVRHAIVELIRAFHLALIVYAFILGAGHYLRTLDIRRRELLRTERMRADLASAQLRALTLQLQPHFLFNALNAVGALIVTQRNREAFEVVGRLGELLRALLAIEQREEVSLREELELAEAYVGIEQARWAERLQVQWELADDIMSAQLPPMLLQPLVENAIRHGVARAPNGGTLVIAGARAGTRLVLEVRDDGPGPTGAPDTSDRPGGLGLDNTRRRLAHLYGEEQSLELVRANGWTCVRVELPYHTLGNTSGGPSDGQAA
jgi:signal transduction histidine kinase